jgi:hypothetical protein
MGNPAPRYTACRKITAILGPRAPRRPGRTLLVAAGRGGGSPMGVHHVLCLRASKDVDEETYELVSVPPRSSSTVGRLRAKPLRW